MLRFSPLADRWEIVDLGPGGQFEVLVRNPPFGAQLADCERPTDFMRGRIEATILDWRGVEKADGQPMPFNFSTLGLICERHPAAFAQVLALTNAAFRGPAEAQKKESGDASASVSTDAAAAENSAG